MKPEKKCLIALGIITDTNLKGSPLPQMAREFY